MRNSIILVTLCACAPENTISLIEKIPTSAEDTSPPPEEIEEIIEEPVFETCPDRIFSAGTASINEDCLIEPPNIEYTPVIEWTIDSFEEYPELIEIEFSEMCFVNSFILVKFDFFRKFLKI